MHARPRLITALENVFDRYYPLCSEVFAHVLGAGRNGAVIGGVTIGTVTTLLFVPYLYSVIGDSHGAGRTYRSL